MSDETTSKAGHSDRDDLREEYRFDYSKSKLNRFAGRNDGEVRAATGRTKVSIPGGAMEACVHAVAQQWPNARFEDPISHFCYDNIADIPFDSLLKLLVYTDVGGEANGDGDTPGSMESPVLSLVSDQDEITIVVGTAEQHEIEAIIDSTWLRDAHGWRLSDRH